MGRDEHGTNKDAKFGTYATQNEGEIVTDVESSKREPQDDKTGIVQGGRETASSWSARKSVMLDRIEHPSATWRWKRESSNGRERSLINGQRRVSPVSQS